MLADYVMKSIDSLFSDKLFTSNQSQLHKSTMPVPAKHFTKQTIRNNLPNIIRRDGNSRSPLRTKEKSPSPISRSPLRSILETNRAEKIKSVVKRSHMRESSPYQKMELDHRHKASQEELHQDLSNKENNMVKHYRQERKSSQNYRAFEKPSKPTNSRVVSKNRLLGRDSSASFH